MARKTIDVAELLKTVNFRNRHSTCSPDVRHGWNSLLEHALMQSGQYAGFGYLYGTDLAEGIAPGIVWDLTGNGKHEYPDETRRVYYSK